MTLKIQWLRSGEKIDFSKRHIWFCQGVPGTGKSAFLENCAEGYISEGGGVLDLFGSRDSEGLAWLRSPYAKDGNVLLLTGEAVDVKSNFDVKKATALSLDDLEKYRVIISASGLYSSIEDEFTNAGIITDKIYLRFHWKRRVAVIIREASSFMYSRLKLNDTQQLAKSSMLYLTRESRHMGLSLLMDSLRWTGVDIDLRELSDFLILKSQGINGLNKELRFLYSYIRPEVLRNIPPQYFFIVTRRGSIGAGTSTLPAWHKIEKENILLDCGLKIEYGTPLEVGADKGTFKTVGDAEHLEIIRLYIEENRGTVDISKHLKRSSKTIIDHIHFHNNSFDKAGFCSRCKRANGVYSSKLAERQTMKETER